MSIALESLPFSSAGSARKLVRAQEPSTEEIAAIREAAATLNCRLLSAPVDLTAISAEIREHSELETLVLRLGESLGISADETVKTVEDAVVVLGTHRLRMLIDLWANGAEYPARPELTNADGASEARSMAGSLEARYLENLLCRLGLEAAQTAAGGEPQLAVDKDPLSALTDLFMRDFFSLLPVIQPSMTLSSATGRAVWVRDSRPE